MNKLVRNERRKLSATFLNGIAIAVMAVGGIAPLAAFAQSGAINNVAIWLALVCIVGSLALHFLALRFLRGMEE